MRDLVYGSMSLLPVSVQFTEVGRFEDIFGDAEYKAFAVWSSEPGRARAAVGAIDVKSEKDESGGGDG